VDVDVAVTVLDCVTETSFVDETLCVEKTVLEAGVTPTVAVFVTA